LKRPQGRAPGRLPGPAAAFERPVIALVEHLAHLGVDRLAEEALRAQRHQRRKLARERVGTVPPSKIIEPKPLRKKPKHRKLVGAEEPE